VIGILRLAWERLSAGITEDAIIIIPLHPKSVFGSRNSDTHWHRCSAVDGPFSRLSLPIGVLDQIFLMIPEESAMCCRLGGSMFAWAHTWSRVYALLELYALLGLLRFFGSEGVAAC
jgi:hypothetical protein